MIPPGILEPGKVVVDTFDCIVPPETREGYYQFSLALLESDTFLSTPKEELRLYYQEIGAISVTENPEITHSRD